MNTIYANRFSITTNENQEAFIIFYLDVPKYDNDSQYVEDETIEKNMVILSKEAYSTFRNMLDEAEAKEEKKNDH